MVHLVVRVGHFLAVGKFHIGVCSFLGPRVAEVNKVPSHVQTVMLDVLEVVPVAVSVEVSIGVGGHVKDASLCCSYPHRKSPAAKHGFVSDRHWVRGQPEREMPFLLAVHRSPPEPAANRVLVRETVAFSTNLNSPNAALVEQLFDRLINHLGSCQPVPFSYGCPLLGSEHVPQVI